MSVEARPLHPLFAAEIGGVDLRRPISDDDIAAFLAIMDRCAVAVIHHDAPFTDEQHIAFTRRLGPLQRMKMKQMVGKSRSRLSSPELIDVGNLDEEGRVLAADDRRRMFNQGNLLWHTDVSFDANRATYSLLAGHTVPPGGGAPTQFADMRAAYDALPPAMREKIDPLCAEHSVWYSRALAGMTDITDKERATRPPAQHRLVHRHPRSGRKSLYLAAHASHIVGWPEKEGRALLDELTAFATQERFVFTHHWRAGDLLIWDNLATMHRGTPFDDTKHPRDVRRTTVLERAEPDPGATSPGTPPRAASRPSAP